MFDKWASVLSKNLGYTIAMIIAIIFFCYFSEGIIEGLIAAVAAMIACMCGVELYGEYKHTPAKKQVPAKKTTAKSKGKNKK